MEKFENSHLFDLSQTIAAELFMEYKYPWQLLPLIKEYIIRTGAALSSKRFEKAGENVWIAKTAEIAPTASICGPAIIDENAEIRHCAFIRGSVIVGKNAVVGNSTELKNCILFNAVEVPHYNYVGDSILGYHSHLGAGAVTSNVKGDKSPVKIKKGSLTVDTGFKKMGAILGDYVEVGCGSVLNPGVIVGKNSQIYPLSMVRGCVDENSIYKKQGEIVTKVSD